MSWLKYAAGVVVSSTLFITGVMWWQQPNPPITGEHAAALTADTYEHFIAMYTRGDYSQTNDFPSPFGTSPGSVMISKSNTISPDRLRSQIQAIAHTLKYSFWASPSYTSLDYGNPALIDTSARWIDIYSSFFADGGAALYVDYPTVVKDTPYTAIEYPYSYYSGATSTVVSYTVVNQQSSTSCIPQFSTLDTRMVKTGVNLTQFNQANDGTPDSPWWHTNIPAATLFKDFPVNASGVPAIRNYGVFGTNGNWWTENKLGTNIYLWPRLEKQLVSSNGLSKTVKYYGYDITTNAFNDFKKVLDAQKYAVLVSTYNPSQWVCATSEKRMFSYYVAKAPDNQYNLASLEAEGVIARASVATQLLNPALVLTNPAVTLPFMVNTLDYYGRQRSLDRSEPAYTGETVQSVAVWANGYVTLLKGVKCTWPSELVYSLGLVKNVTYYGIFANHPYVDLMQLYIYAHQDLYHTPYGSNIYQYDDTFGTGYYPCVYPSMYLNADSQNRDLLGSVASTPAAWIVTELSSVDNPTNSPTINIGSYTFDTTFTPSESAYSSYDYPPAYYPNTNWSYYYKDKYRYVTHRPQTIMLGLVCVVEFNFTDYSKGNKTATYTPFWATTNLVVK